VGINAMAIAMARDNHYPNRTIRLSDEVWESLKVAQKQSGKSWNQFIKSLNKNGDGRK
jgi:predicted CopG family antitoxin